MKKFKSLFAILFCVFASSIMGACSCTGSDISVTKIELDTTSKDVVVENEFFIQYTLSPSKSTNTKVFVTIVDGKDKISIKDDNYIMDGSFTEKVYFVANKVGNAKIEFKTEDKNLVKTCAVEVHEKPEALTAPVISFNNGRVEWEAIESSKQNNSIDGYLIDINGSEFQLPIYQNYYDGNGEGQIKLLPETEYEIKVKALGDKLYDENSEFSNTIKVNVLNAPQNAKVENGVLTWDVVTNPLNSPINDIPLNITYKVQYANGLTENTDGLSFQFKNKELLNFTLFVTAYANEEYENGVLDTFTGVTTYVYHSDASDTFRIQKLTAPQSFELVSNNINALGSANNSYLKWNAVSNATGYTVVIIDNENNEKRFENLKSTEFHFEDYVELDFVPGDYKAYVVAEGDKNKQIFGENSTTQTMLIKKLPSVIAEVTEADNLLTINTDNLTQLNLNYNDINKLGFELYIKNTATQEIMLYTHTGGNVVDLSALSSLPAGRYVCGVRPINNLEITDDEENKIWIANHYVNDDLSNMNFSDPFAKLAFAKVDSISNEGYAKFAKVENATDYKLSIYLKNDKENPLVTTTLPLTSEYISESDNILSVNLNKIYDLSILTPNEKYVLTVDALSTNAVNGGVNQNNTFEFQKLASVSTINVENNVISWENVNNYGYNLKFNNVNSGKLSINNFTPNASEIKDENTISVIALGNDTNILSSNPYEVTVLQLSVISEFEMSNGTLSWENYANNTYVLSYYTGTTLNKTEEISSNSISSLDLNEVGFTVYRKQLGYFNSKPSTTIRVKQLQTVNNATILSDANTTTITWDVVDDASAYTVSYENESGLKYIDTASNTVTLPLTEGLYNVSVVAKCSDTNPLNGVYVLNSKPCNVVEFEVLQTPIIYVSNGELSISITNKNMADKFVVVIDEDEYEILPNRNVGTFNFESLPAGTYDVEVKAIAKAGTNVINSQTATLTNIVKISAPSVYTENGVLKFNSVENASSYNVYEHNGSEFSILPDRFYSISTQNNVNTLTINRTTSEIIKIKAIATTGKINSSLGTEFEYSPLSAPTYITKTGAVITWNNVDNNSGYVITSGSDVWNVEKDVTSFTVPEQYLATAGEYEFNISAKGNSVATGKGYLNSTSASISVIVLNDPANVTLTNSVISWNAYSKASSSSIDEPEYTLINVYKHNPSTGLKDLVYSENLAISITSFNLLEVEEIDEGDYEISITFVGDGNYTLSSAEVYYEKESNKTISKLASIELYVNDGEIYFDAVENADSYKLFTVNSGSDYMELTSANYDLTNNAGVYKLTLKSLANNRNTLVVRAMASNTMISSDLSDEFTVEKLGVSTISVADGIISWTEVDNARGFLLINNTDNVTYDPFQSATLTAQVGGLGLDFTKNVYEFKVQVLGSADSTEFTDESGTKIYYLNSDISSSTATVNVVTAVKNVQLNNGVLTWKNVDGVISYKLTITITGQAEDLVKFERIDSAYSETTSFNFNDLIEIPNYNDDISVKITIEPYSVYNDTYYITPSATEQTSIQIVKPRVISDVYVKDGLFAWDIDFGSLSTEQKIGAYNAYQGLKNGTLNETSPEVQKYYRYFKFDISINGSIIRNVTPSLHEFEGLSKITFFYQITEPVKTPTSYSFSVSSCGNISSINADGTSNNDGVLPSNYSTSISASKFPVLGTTTTLDGNIYFERIPNASEKYLLTAIPADSALATKQIKLEQSTSGTTGLVIGTDELSDQATIYKVFNLFTGENALEYNVKYTYRLCLLGSENQKQNGVLRSNFYNDISITFIDTIKDFEYTTNRGDALGGVLTWTPNKVDRVQTLYLLNINDYNNNSESWQTHENVIKIELPFDTNYFEFNKTDVDIAPGRYMSCIICKGNGTDYVNLGKYSLNVEIEKLPSVSQIGTSWLQNGNFAWNFNFNNNAIYSYLINVYKTDASGKETLLLTTNILRTSTSYVLPDEYAEDNCSYSIKITPLGTSYNNVNYVAGTPVSTTAYYRLGKISPYFSEATNDLTVRWNNVTYADSYTVKINSSEISSIGTNEYSISSYTSGGEYGITVKAISTGTDYLSGVYGDSITLRKMFLPQVRTNNGVVVWGRTDNIESLTPEKTRIGITPCDSNGVVTGQTTEELVSYDSQNISKSFTYELGENFESGYYKVDVNFETTSKDNKNYIIGSEVSSIIVYKHNKVEIENGVYTAPGEEGECKFSNYVKWNAIDNCEDYRVQLLVETSNGLTPIEARYEYYTMKLNPSYFESKNGVVYFSLQLMSSYQKNSATVKVVALGNTTEYNVSESYYVNSKTASMKVDINVRVAPDINAENSDFSKGIVAWNSNGINCMVEVTVNGEAYKTVINGSDISRQLVTITDETFTAHSTDEVFYLPYVGTNLTVKLRYYDTSYAGDYSNVITVSNHLFYSGSGLSDDPYMIYSETNDNSELQIMFTNIWYRPNSHIELTSNIDMEGVSWTNNLNDFNGVIDGKNYVVSNLALTPVYDDNLNKSLVSMFKTIGENAVIKDITLNLNTTTSGFYDVVYGTIAYINNGTLENIKLTGQISFSNWENVFGGALVYENNNMISNVTLGEEATHLEISLESTNEAEKEIGGISYTNNGNIENSNVNNVDLVVKNKKNTAILAGVSVHNSGTIKKCNINSNATLKSNNIGGVVYKNDADGLVIGCSFTGKITAEASSASIIVGGIIGYNQGIVAQSYAVMLNSDVFNITSVSGSSIGGLIGYNETDYASSDAQILNCYVVNNVGGISNANYGLVIGYLHSGIVENNYVSSSVSNVKLIGYEAVTVNQNVITKVDEPSKLLNYERDENGYVKIENEKPVLTILNVLNNYENGVKFVINGSCTINTGTDNVDFDLDNANIPFVIE